MSKVKEISRRSKRMKQSRSCQQATTSPRVCIALSPSAARDDGSHLVSDGGVGGGPSHLWNGKYFMRPKFYKPGFTQHNSRTRGGGNGGGGGDGP